MQSRCLDLVSKEPPQVKSQDKIKPSIGFRHIKEEIQKTSGEHNLNYYEGIKCLQFKCKSRVFLSCPGQCVETDQFDEQVKSMMTRAETTEGNQKRILQACNICGKEDQKINIKSHIEANHITSNISYSCDVCGNASRSKTGLRFHKGRQHST